LRPVRRATFPKELSVKYLTYPIVKIPPLIKDYWKSLEIFLPEYGTPKKSPPFVKYFWGFTLGLILAFLLYLLVIGEWSLITLFLLSLGVIFLGFSVIVLIKSLPELFLVCGNYSQSKKWKKAQSLMARYKDRKTRELDLIKPGLLQELLTDKVEHSSIISPWEKAVSEKFFLSILKHYFGEGVSYGFSFPIPKSKFSFSHDLIYIDFNTGLSIDIEIDEPYEGKSKYPHHCQDNEQDRNRDNFFLEKNWIIVRFAEEQVVKYPHACAFYLAELISRLTGEKFQVSRGQLKPVSTWTFAQARLLAYQCHRERYLRHHRLWD
jgi:hypothetical protein